MRKYAYEWYFTSARRSNHTQRPRFVARATPKKCGPLEDSTRQVQSANTTRAATKSQKKKKKQRRDVGRIRTYAPEGTRFLVLRDNHSATTPEDRQLVSAVDEEFWNRDHYNPINL